jgi:hypothetical protein
VRRTFAVAVVASATGALTFGSAISADAATNYYAAGTRQSDQPSQTSDTEWKAFIDAGAAYTVQYPRDLAPLIGTTTLDDSVADGVAAALHLIDAHDDGTGVVLAGVSQGAVVMAETRQALIAGGVDPKTITVATFGDPTNPDGGFLAKLDRWNIHIPGFRPVTTVPGDGGYETVAIEYDLIADSPDTLNPVSWANAALGAYYDHPSYSLTLLDQAEADGRVVTTTDEYYRVSDDGQTTETGYYRHDLIKQTNLPLTRPIREAGTAIADDKGDVVVNRVVDQVDNLLRPIVDAGYDGGLPGGSRHVSTVTKHYQDQNGNPVSAKQKRPVREAVKKFGDAVKKLRESLAPKAIG